MESSADTPFPETRKLLGIVNTTEIRLAQKALFMNTITYKIKYFFCLIFWGLGDYFMMICFQDRSLLCPPRQDLFDIKYSKNSNIEK